MVKRIGGGGQAQLNTVFSYIKGVAGRRLIELWNVIVLWDIKIEKDFTVKPVSILWEGNPSQ